MPSDSSSLKPHHPFRNLSPTHINNAIMSTLAICAIYLRIDRLINREMTGDEREQLNSLALSTRKLLFKYCAGMAGGHPGDYLLTKPFASLPFSLWRLSFPHICMLGLALYFLYRICNNEFRTWLGPLAVFTLFTFNRNLIFHALELRPYASLPTLALALYWFSKKAVQNNQWTMGQQIGWGTLWALAIVFHSYGLMMSALILGYHLLFSRRDQTLGGTIRSLFFPTVLATLLVAPIWIYYAGPSVQIYHKYDTFELSHSGFRAVFSCIFGNLGDINLRWAWMAQLLIVAAGALVPDKQRAARVGFLILCVILPIALILFIDYRQHYWFLPRQFVWVMPLWGILVGQSLESIYFRWRDPR
jgi:hypothetical protein